MSDQQAYIIPKTLDDPLKIMFWTLDEIGVIFGPVLFGILLGHIVLGGIAGLCANFAWKKVKKNNPQFLIQMIYWHFPSNKLLGFKKTPPSSHRFYIG